MQNYHTIIVGAGSGGLTVAVGLSKLGKKVALVEGHHVGGDCTNVGCVPSKSLIHGSYQAVSGEKTGAEVLENVRRLRNHLRDEESGWVKELKNLDYFQAWAKFEDRNTLVLTSDDGQVQKISAKNIVLSTGAKPRVLEIEGLPEDKVLTNESIFELEAVPKHLVIIGGGVIGLEMAFAFSRLGSKISLLDRGDRLLKVAEPEASAVVLKRLKEQGVSVFFGAEATRFEEKDARLVLASGEVIEAVDQVLIAAGRVPNLKLDLEKAGVEFDRKGVPTDSLGRTNVPSVFAIGDINHRSAFTHSANHQGRRLVKKLAFPFLPDPGAEPHYPAATFSEPEVAQVGPTLEKLLASYPQQLIKTQTVQLKDTDRGYTMELEDGFVMIHCHALTGKLLSATIVAPAAGEMISILTLAINQGISMYKLADLVFPYPVLSDAIKKAANGFVFETLGGLGRELWNYARFGVGGLFRKGA